MKVAISSASFAAALAERERTQLEWLENCASQLGADGVVFERAHFPRDDREYVAQIRKVAIDLGLVPVAVAEPRLFSPLLPPAERDAAIALAERLGALFVVAPLPAPGDVPPAAFVAAVQAGKAAVKAAKAGNVTLLVETAPGTLAEDAAGVRHFHKDVDSAWLRYALPAGLDRAALTARDRVLAVTVDPGTDLESLVEIDEAARPWLLLRGEVGPSRIAELRRASAKRTLASTSVILN